MKKVTVEAEFFYGAPPEIFRISKELRKTTTEAEKELWKHLKGKQIKGYHFRRQHPIHRFIADFFCYKCKLVIEIDGKIHNEITVKERDKERENIIIQYGIKVLRFTNEAILNDIETVLKQIEASIGENA